MSRTNRDRLTEHPEWIGLVRRVWTTRIGKGSRIPKYLRHKISYGPGGTNCVCCFYAPGKDRKAEFRRAKRSEKQEWKKEVCEYV